MIREIEFRGKCTFSGEWFFGGMFKTYKEDPNDNNGRYLEKYFIMEDNDPVPNGVDPKTIGQHIGLKDANGVKICEGDILEYHFDHRQNIVDGTPFNCIGFKRIVIAFSDGAFKKSVIAQANCRLNCLIGVYVNFNAAILSKNYKIIGNIHDNPELLPNVK